MNIHAGDILNCKKEMDAFNKQPNAMAIGYTNYMCFMLLQKVQAMEDEMAELRKEIKQLKSGGED